MKRLLSIVIISVILETTVNGLWSSKCKEAETSSDKIVRMIQNANCTVIEESRKLFGGFNSIREGMRSKMEVFKQLFKKNSEESERNSVDENAFKNDLDDTNSDPKIDIRMTKNNENEQRKKRESTEAENENFGNLVILCLKVVA